MALESVGDSAGYSSHEVLSTGPARIVNTRFLGRLSSAEFTPLLILVVGSVNPTPVSLEGSLGDHVTCEGFLNVLKHENT